MAVCLVEIIDDDVSQNHCVSNCSTTKTVASSDLSQHILTRIVDYGDMIYHKYDPEFKLDFTKRLESTQYNAAFMPLS